MKSSPQILLGSNRRAIAVASIILGLLSLACLAAMAQTYWVSGPVIILVIMGVVFLVTVNAMIGLLAWGALPRIAVTPDHLLVYLQGNEPYRVPLDAVECFFQGQGSPQIRSAKNAKSTNVVVRLAERASNWHQRPTKSSLGEWQDGYIIVCGTWCEPITETKLRLLNSQLADVKRQRKAQTAKQS